MRFFVKPIVGAVVLAGIYTAAGYIGVPAGVRWAINNVLPDALSGRTATVGDVSFNPWNWTLTLKNLAVSSANQPQNHLLELDQAVVDASFSSLTNMAPVLDAVALDGLRVQLTANELNNAEAKNAIEAGAAQSPSTKGGLPAFSLSNVFVKNSSVRFINVKKSAQVDISEINFSLPVISTLPGTGSSSVTPKLSFKINGKPVDAKGSMKGEKASLAVSVSELDAARLVRALPLTHDYDVRSALVSTNINLDFLLPKSGTPVFTASGTTQIKNLEVRNNTGAPFAKAAQATVDIGRFDLAGQTIEIKSVSVVNPEADLTIDSGLSAAQTAAKTQPKSASPKGAAAKNSEPASAGWNWSLESASVSGGLLRITDNGVAPKSTITVSGLAATAKHFSSKPGTSGSYAVSAAVNGGNVSSEGTISLAPLALRASTNLKGLSLASINPWIKTASGYSIPKGSAEAAGTLDFKSGAKTALTWKGKAALQNLQTLDPKGTQLASVKNLAVDVALFDLNAQKISVTSIVADAPSVNLAFSSTQSAAAPKAAPKTDAKNTAKPKAPKTTASSEAASSWQWSLASARITNGAVKLTDTGLKPAQSLSVTGIAATAKNFSSAKGAAGTYTLSANVNGGTLSSDGTLTLAPLSLAAATNVSRLGFSGFNPWIKSISGASLTKGTADVIGKLNVKSGEKMQLTWTGDLAIDNFEAKNAKGKTLMTWKQVTGNGIKLASIDPLSVTVGELTVKEPAQKAVKTTSALLGLFGQIAEATGHKNTARRMQKAEDAVTQDITVRNLTYSNGRFSLGGAGRDALESIVVDALNNVFTKTSGRY